MKRSGRALSDSPFVHSLSLPLLIDVARCMYRGRKVIFGVSKCMCIEKVACGDVTLIKIGREGAGCCCSCCHSK